GGAGGSVTAGGGIRATAAGAGGGAGRGDGADFELSSAHTTRLPSPKTSRQAMVRQQARVMRPSSIRFRPCVGHGGRDDTLPAPPCLREVMKEGQRTEDRGQTNEAGRLQHRCAGRPACLSSVLWCSMPSRPRVFVTRRIPPVGLDRIAAACDAEVWPERLPPPYDVIRQKIADCDGLVSLLTDRIDAALLDAAPRLKVVSNFAVGFNNIDVPAATARGVCVGNTPGALTDATADCAFLLLIAAARRLVDGVLDVRAGRWQTWEPVGYLGVDLAGKTIGVIGLGRIGAALARRCHRGWDM